MRTLPTGGGGGYAGGNFETPERGGPSRLVSARGVHCKQNISWVQQVMPQAVTKSSPLPVCPRGRCKSSCPAASCISTCPHDARSVCCTQEMAETCGTKWSLDFAPAMPPRCPAGRPPPCRPLDPRATPAVQPTTGATACNPCYRCPRMPPL